MGQFNGVFYALLYILLEKLLPAKPEKKERCLAVPPELIKKDSFETQALLRKKQEG